MADEAQPARLTVVRIKSNGDLYIPTPMYKQCPANAVHERLKRSVTKSSLLIIS